MLRGNAKSNLSYNLIQICHSSRFKTKTKSVALLKMSVASQTHRGFEPLSNQRL
jgi:hypothetical protein